MGVKSLRNQNLGIHWYHMVYIRYSPEIISHVGMEVGKLSDLHWDSQWEHMSGPG